MKRTGRAHGLDADDLVQQAQTQACQRLRHWRKAEVRYVVFLKSVMRSIAANWAKRKERVLFRSDLVTAPMTAPPDAADSDDAKTPNRLALLKAEVAYDLLLSGVLADRIDGIKPREIRQKRKLSVAQYEAIIKRLKRTAESLEKRKTV